MSFSALSPRSPISVFTAQCVSQSDVRNLMNEVSSCQKLEKRLAKQDILYYRGIRHNPVSFSEERYLDRIIMAKANEYNSWENGYPGRNRVDEVNSTLHLSHYVLRQKLQQFYFSNRFCVRRKLLQLLRHLGIKETSLVKKHTGFLECSDPLEL